MLALPASKQLSQVSISKRGTELPEKHAKLGTRASLSQPGRLLLSDVTGARHAGTVQHEFVPATSLHLLLICPCDLDVSTELHGAGPSDGSSTSGREDGQAGAASGPQLDIFEPRPALSGGLEAVLGSEAEALGSMSGSPWQYVRRA